MALATISPSVGAGKQRGRHGRPSRRVRAAEGSALTPSSAPRTTIDAGDDGFLLIERLGVIPGGDVLLDRGVVGPAEPDLVAIRAQADVADRARAITSIALSTSLVLLRALGMQNSPYGERAVDVRHGEAYVGRPVDRHLAPLLGRNHR